MKTAIRNRANNYLSVVSRQYWPHVPLGDISAALSALGIEVESCILCGAGGQDRIALTEQGKPSKSMLCLSWYRMPVTGNYEVTAYVS